MSPVPKVTDARSGLLFPLGDGALAITYLNEAIHAATAQVSAYARLMRLKAISRLGWRAHAGWHS